MILAAITTCKRMPDMVERALKSVITQTYQDWNLVVVDDSPSDWEFRDDVRKMVEGYAHKDKRVRYVAHDRNYGAQRARNTALNIADKEGFEFIAYLDDDDEWLPEKLEKQLAVFESHDEKLGLVYCASDYTYKDPGTGNYYLFHRQIRPNEGYVYDKLIFRDFIGTFSRPLIRTKYLRAAGGMDEKMPVRQDWETWLRISKICKISYVNEALFLRHAENGVEHLGSNYKKVPEAIDIIERKNLDYLQKHKDAYYSLYCYRVKIYGINSEFRKCFSAWFKIISLQPMRIFTNTRLIITSLILGIKSTMQRKFPSQFLYISTLKRTFKYKSKGERIS